MQTLDRTMRGGRAQSPLVRLMLYEREVFRLPEACRELSVVAGQAWVTQGARDLILAPGEALRLAGDGDGVLISPLGGETLVVEAWA